MYIHIHIIALFMYNHFCKIRLNKDTYAYNEGAPKQGAPNNPCDMYIYI